MDTAHLSALIERRYELICDLVTLTDTQAVISTSDEISATLGILARKDTLIDQLKQVHLQLAPYRNQNPEERVWPEPGKRQHCQRLAEQSDQMLKDIVELDEQTIRTMQRGRDAISTRLQHVQDSLSAHQAYNAERQLAESVLDVANL